MRLIVIPEGKARRRGTEDGESEREKERDRWGISSGFHGGMELVYTVRLATVG